MTPSVQVARLRRTMVAAGTAPPTSPDSAPARARARARGPFAMMLLALALDAALLAIGVGGPRALLHHPRALALLASWVVAYPLLTRPRPPAGEREQVRADPLVLLLLTVIPTVTPLLSALAERRGLWPLPGGMALRWAGVALSAAGFALRIAAMRRLGTRFAPVAALERGHRLETGGVYARLRHPGYLGAWLGNFGIVLAFGSAATLVLALALLAAQIARIRGEEALLEQRFGEEYRAYRRRAGMFLPRL